MKNNLPFEFLKQTLKSIVVIDADGVHPAKIYTNEVFADEKELRWFQSDLRSVMDDKGFIILTVEEAKMHSFSIGGTFQFSFNHGMFGDDDPMLLLTTPVDIVTLTSDHFRMFLNAVNELFGEGL